MFTLKCNLGHSNAFIDAKITGNLNEITWTDIDVPFTIPFVNIREYLSVDTDYLYDELKIFMTSGIDAMYGVLVSGYSETSYFWQAGLPTLRNQFPSIDLQYNNFWNYRKGGGGERTCWYFRQTKRLVASSKYGWSVYEVLEDSTCRLILPHNQRVQINFFLSVVSSPNYDYYASIYKTVYLGGDDYTNFENYGYVQATVGIGGRHSSWIVFDPLTRYTSEEQEYLQKFFVAFWGDYVPGNVPDPYEPGGDSGEGGGEGTFEDIGDEVPIPDLPSLSAYDTRFISLFNPTVSELRNLADYMWSDLFDLDTLKKIFANPMDAILGMSIVPVNIPNSGPQPVTIGNISTGINMTKASSQFVSVDCGTLDVKEYWGAYLDYDPYTKTEIYLPYIGTHALATDDIMNKKVQVVYHVDILSGACCAYIKCNNSVLYSFVGQCSCSIPITGNDWTNVINGAISIAATIGTMIATGGASAPMQIGSIASAAVNSLKPNVEKSGSLSGMGGMMCIQKPYLILTRPRQALPKDQNKFSGYPSFINEKLSEISGYTEIEVIHLENVPATEQELTEIENLLKEGVIF